MTTGTILHLQRLSTEDGPGIRTTVFFKGCPLRCRWCHNPESFSLAPQVQWLENRCIGCRSCIEACPQHALQRTPAGGIQRDLGRCTACAECVEACPSGAMELLGRSVAAEELGRELLKDRVYFEKSGGGVTLSGGEPTLQPALASELTRLLHAAGVGVALDTCGLCAPAVLESLLAEVDVILYDLKLVDAALHAHWTGVSNARILENLQRVAATVRRQPGKSLWVRTPLIPGTTLSEENLQALGRILAGLDGTVARWELCAFNNLCRDKYRRLGLEWEFASTPLLAQAELSQAGDWARSSGFDPRRVFVTGATRSLDFQDKH